VNQPPNTTTSKCSTAVTATTPDTITTFSLWALTTNNIYFVRLNIVPWKTSFEYEFNGTISVTYNPHLVGLIYGQSSILKCVHALFIGMEGVQI
jgi:hypothetical protein